MDLTFTSDITVQLIQVAGSDETICRSAWVSSLTDEPDASQERMSGLINSLLKQKHGCYDEETEVLTDFGWKYFKDLQGDESFLTLDLSTNQLSYQLPDRLIIRQHDGELVAIKTQHVDLLVTEDHRMVTSTLDKKVWQPYGIVQARDFFDRTYRIPLGCGEYKTTSDALIGLTPAFMELLGFFLGDGNCSPTQTITFHLRRPRKVAYLYELAQRSGYGITRRDDTYILHAEETFVRFAQQCYQNKEKYVPRRLLLFSNKEQLQALLAGLIEADGHRTAQGKITISTTSKYLVDAIQTIAAKLGTTASYHIQQPGKGHFGTKPLYAVTWFRERNMRPRIGWTKAAREKEVTKVPYNGNVYCATVPNGTLYVRRNGKACWCGNSPFESGFLEFWIDAPRAVRDEHVRHRTGWSYSSSSLRYNQGEARLYIPPPNRPLKEAAGFKKMRPVYEPYTDNEYRFYKQTLEEAYTASYDAMQRLHDNDITATEASRWITHDGKMTPYIARCNPRSLMHFLSLRTHDPDANHVSYPMWEIERVATKMEIEFAQHFPLTYAAYNEFGRESP